MSYGLESLETRQLEGIVNILNHCTDSFLYVFDLSKDTYFISPFARNLFNFPEEKLENATHELMKIVYPDDQASLRAEIDLLKSGKKTELFPITETAVRVRSILFGSTERFRIISFRCIRHTGSFFHR